MTIAAMYGAKATVGALGTIMNIGQSIATDAKTINSYKANTSLIDVSSGTRVEPLTLVGTDCIHLEYLPDVLQSVMSIFAGYYLQAVAVLTQVNGATVARSLARLNPDRKGDLVGASLSIVDSGMGDMPKFRSDWKINSLSYLHRLPTSKNQKAMAFEQEFIALENNVHLNSGMTSDQIRHLREMADFTYRKNEEDRRATTHSKNEEDRLRHRFVEEQNFAIKRNEEQRKNIKHDKDENDRDNKNKINNNELRAKHEENTASKYQHASAQINDNQIKSIREITDLSIGKMINVTIGGGVDINGKKIPDVTIPISIRLMVNGIPDTSLVPLLCTGTADHSFSERYHAYKAGRIEFIRDMIFCQDLIDENKKAMLHDHTGIHSQIIDRVNNNKLAGLANRDPSLNVASNLYIISEVTAKAIEHKLGGKLNNPHTREKIFNAGYAMIIVVIDREWEQITFYHRGISSSSTVSLKDIKKASKGSGPDVGDILKAYQLGNAPQF